MRPSFAPTVRQSEPQSGAVAQPAASSASAANMVFFIESLPFIGGNTARLKSFLERRLRAETHLAETGDGHGTRPAAPEITASRTERYVGHAVGPSGRAGNRHR